MVGDLVTWETVKAILNLDDDRQDVVEFLISSASAQIENYVDRILAARDIELKLDCKGGVELKLPYYPVNEITSLTVSEIPVYYTLDNKNGIIRFDTPMPEGWGNVSFKGNVGYDPVPMDLQKAVLDLVSIGLRRYAQNGGNVGIKSFSANGAITTQYEVGLPLEVKEILNSKYKREPKI